jgi:hypothetical protein
MLSGTQGDLTAEHALVGDHRPGRRSSERRDRAALIAGDLPGYRGVGHGQAADAEQGAQLGPGDGAVAGHKHENVVALAAPHHHRLHHIGRLDAAGLRGLGQAAHRAMPDDPVGDTGCVESVKN